MDCVLDFLSAIQVTDFNSDSLEVMKDKAQNERTYCGGYQHGTRG